MSKQVIVAFILLCAGIALSGWFGPWYAPAAVVLLMCALLALRTKHAIWLGLVSYTLVYAIMALVMLGKDDAGIMAKTGNLLGGLSPIMVLLITLVLAGLTGLVSGWLGSVIGQYFRSTTN